MALEVTLVAVAACATLCAMAAEVLAVKLESPLYLAAMECEPNDKPERESCAALPETLIVPNKVAPSRKVTVPVAVPP